MLKEIRRVDNIRIEGLNEDIELSLNNGKKVYVQAKSKSSLGTDIKALYKLNEGIRTLIHAANNKDFEKLYFVTNYPNPIGGKHSHYYYFMGGTYIERSFEELPQEAKLSALKKITAVENEFKLKLDVEKLYISVIPFEGEDKLTRYRVINTEIKEFLNDISLNEGISKELLEMWQSDMFFNASNINTKIEITKRNIIWPIVVLNCELNEEDKLIEHIEEELGLNFEDIELILKRYGGFIDKQIERLDFLLKVINDYKKHKENNKGQKRKIEFFVNEKWSEYQDEIYSDGLEDEFLEAVIKIILSKLLSKKGMVSKIIQEVGL